VQVSVAAQQVRVSDSSGVKLFIYSHTDPTFENVSACVIGPYNFEYPLVAQHFADSRKTGSPELNLQENLWLQVCDFTKNPDHPNWRPMLPDEFHTEKLELEGFEAPGQNPVPRPVRFGGSLPDDVLPHVDQKDHGPAMMEFDIKTNALDALNALKAKTKHTHIQEEDEGGIREERFTPLARPESDSQTDFGSIYPGFEQASFDPVFPGSSQHFETSYFQENNSQTTGLGLPQQIEPDLFDSAHFSQSAPSQPLQLSAQQSRSGGLPPADAEEQARERRFQDREAERMRSLYQSSVASTDQMKELEAKQRRAAAGRAFKESFMRSWREGLAARKASKQSAQQGSHSDPWKAIAQGIGASAGEYRGEKDVRRMREAILNRANHK